MGRSGLDLLTLSFSHFAPQRTFREHFTDVGGLGDSVPGAAIGQLSHNRPWTH